jgi:hypothetical protein
MISQPSKTERLADMMMEEDKDKKPRNQIRHLRRLFGSGLITPPIIIRNNHTKRVEAQDSTQTLNRTPIPNSTKTFDSEEKFIFESQWRTSIYLLRTMPNQKQTLPERCE